MGMFKSCAFGVSRDPVHVSRSGFAVGQKAFDDCVQRIALALHKCLQAPIQVQLKGPPPGTLT
jgi:hypothetical protein